MVKHDLQLLAQISASSEDFYFTSFMKNVLELFSTDRRLLETRGSLIIRQLCLHLNAERIFRTIAEILEKDDDLEFASMMVIKLNMILITSPELADFRRRLKNLESKVRSAGILAGHILTGRTGRCCFRRCTARGATTQWRCLRYVCLRRRMSTHRTCFRFCELYAEWILGESSQQR